MFGYAVYMYISINYSTLERIAVSVPAMLSVGEGDRIVQVCVTLISFEPIRKTLTVTLETSSDTGTELSNV